MKELAGIIGKRILRVMWMEETSPPVLMLQFTDGSGCMLAIKEGWFSTIIFPDVTPETVQDVSKHLKRENGTFATMGLEDNMEAREFNRRLRERFIRLWGIHSLGPRPFQIVVPDVTVIAQLMLKSAVKVARFHLSN